MQCTPSCSVFEQSQLLATPFIMVLPSVFGRPVSCVVQCYRDMSFVLWFLRRSSYADINQRVFMKVNWSVYGSLGFNPRSVHVGCTVNVITLPYFDYPLAVIIPLCIHLSSSSSGVGTVGPVEVAMSREILLRLIIFLKTIALW